MPEDEEAKQREKPDVAPKGNDLDPFDKRMMAIFKREKPFIMKGPQILRQDL